MSGEVLLIGERLRQLQRTLATAESCTGGMLGSVLTSLPGASDWYRGGLVVYSNELKISLAGVRPDTLDAGGAVSPEVACQLARGVRMRCTADLGIGITGVAGPGGGSPDKPVGTVCLALATDSEVRDWTVQLPGDRGEVRAAAVRFALARLLDHVADA